MVSGLLSPKRLWTEIEKNSGSVVSTGIISDISDAMKNLVVLSEKAILHHGGNFIDLFGDLKSHVASVPNEFKDFVDVDLREDNFLKTGQDPFFDAPRDVFFMLFTNENRAGQIISADNIESTTFDKFIPVRVLIHGYMNNYSSPINAQLMKAYLDEGNYNVVGCKHIFSPIFCKCFH